MGPGRSPIVPGRSIPFWGIFWGKTNRLKAGKNLCGTTISATGLGEKQKGKKRPLGSHPRGPVPSFDAPSPSSWCSPVRSRRTVRRGGEDRSGFGCPQAIKKAAGNAATMGRMRRKCWRPSRTTLFRQSAVPWAWFTNCQKKGGFPNPSPYDASSPHRRERIEDDGKNT